MSTGAANLARVGEAEFSQGRWETAHKHFQEAIRLDPDCARYYFCAAMSDWAGGQIDRAGPYLQKAVRLDPQYGAAHSWLGEWYLIQGMIEDAASAYQPEKYEGRVLLLLAADRPPNTNFLPGWHEVVPNNLHAQYVPGHHTELLEEPNVGNVARVFVSHLMATNDEKSLSAAPTLLNQRA